MKIIAVVVVILMAVLFLPFYITVNLSRKNDNDNIDIGVILFGIIKLDYEIPFMDIINSQGQVGLELIQKTEEQSSKKDINRDRDFLKIDDIVHKYKKFKKNKILYQVISDYIVKKTKIKRISLITKIGVDDAAITAIVSGLLWSIESFILSILLRDKCVNNYYIDVIPEFNQSVFEIDFYCIIKLKLVYIIIAGYKGVKVKIKGGGLNV